MTGHVIGALKDQVNLGGNSDIFIGKFEMDGTPVWVKQLGSDLHEVSDNINVDSTGNILLTGTTSGEGKVDQYLEKYDKNGDFVWREILNFSPDTLLLDSQNNIILGIATPNTLIDDGDGGSIQGFYLEKRDDKGKIVWRQNDIDEIPYGTNGIW